MADLAQGQRAASRGAPARAEASVVVERRSTIPPATGGDSAPSATINAINQRIFETSLDLILVVDGRGNFIRVSPSSLTILG